MPCNTLLANSLITSVHVLVPWLRWTQLQALGEVPQQKQFLGFSASNNLRDVLGDVDMGERPMTMAVATASSAS